MLRNRYFLHFLIITLGTTLGIESVVAAESDDDLAKKLANPIAALISVPFQYNYDKNIGCADGHRSLLNIQPVIPSR